MLGAFSSEWIKLRRRSDAAVGLRRRALLRRARDDLHDRAGVEDPTAFDACGDRYGSAVAVLELPNGLVHGVIDVSALIGIVSLCLFAGAFATEYSQGTMRNLLVREPRRVAAPRRQVPRAGALHCRRRHRRDRRLGRRRVHPRPRQGHHHQRPGRAAPGSTICSRLPSTSSSPRSATASSAPPSASCCAHRAWRSASRVAYFIPIEAIIVGAIWSDRQQLASRPPARRGLARRQQRRRATTTRC